METSRPAAVDTISAGICETRPSPTVSTVKAWAASPNGMPCWATPMIRPPMTLMNTIRRPAMASPLTNLEAPSIAPKNELSSSRFLRRRRASFSSIRPADRSASIAICLPGMASKVKRAATSAMRPEPLVMTTKFTSTRMANTMMPITKLPAITKLPNAWMTWPAASVPSWPCARIRRVEARLRARRSMVEISSTVGKDGELQRRLDEQRRHQDQHREDDRRRQEQVEQQRRQRQDQHHQDGEHADRQREVAAAQRVEHRAERRKLEAGCAAAACGRIGHAKPMPWPAHAGVATTRQKMPSSGLRAG